MAGVPFKVCIADRGNLTVGVVARSYEHFCSVLKTRLGLASDYSVRLDDGTLICDEDYFHLLEPQTKLTVTSTLTRLPAWKESDYTRHNSCLTWNGSGSTNVVSTLGRRRPSATLLHSLSTKRRREETLLASALTAPITGPWQHSCSDYPAVCVTALPPSSTAPAPGPCILGNPSHRNAATDLVSQLRISDIAGSDGTVITSFAPDSVSPVVHQPHPLLPNPQNTRPLGHYGLVPSCPQRASLQAPGQQLPAQHPHSAVQPQSGLNRQQQVPHPHLSHFCVSSCAGANSFSQGVPLPPHYCVPAQTVVQRQTVTSRPMQHIVHTGAGPQPTLQPSLPHNLQSLSVQPFPQPSHRQSLLYQQHLQQAKLRNTTLLVVPSVAPQPIARIPALEELIGPPSASPTQLTFRAAVATPIQQAAPQNNPAVRSHVQPAPVIAPAEKVPEVLTARPRLVVKNISVQPASHSVSEDEEDYLCIVSDEEEPSPASPSPSLASSTPRLSLSDKIAPAHFPVTPDEDDSQLPDFKDVLFTLNKVARKDSPPSGGCPPTDKEEIDSRTLLNSACTSPTLSVSDDGYGSSTTSLASDLHLQLPFADFDSFSSDGSPEPEEVVDVFSRKEAIAVEIDSDNAEEQECSNTGSLLVRIPLELVRLPSVGQLDAVPVQLEEAPAVPVAGVSQELPVGVAPCTPVEPHVQEWASEESMFSKPSPPKWLAWQDIVRCSSEIADTVLPLLAHEPNTRDEAVQEAVSPSGHEAVQEAVSPSGHGEVGGSIDRQQPPQASLSKVISQLLSSADLLTNKELHDIQAFFSGQPLDPRKSIRTYNLQRQQLATGGLIEYHLQLDFWSGRWQAQAIVMS